MRIAIDSGGTFTDFVIYENGRVTFFKKTSTPENPANVLIENLKSREGYELLHGSTVATNAILEGKIAKTCLITNKGFEDILTVARQTRPEIYALEPVIPKPLIGRADCFGISGRILHDGSILEDIDEHEIDVLSKALEGYDSVAVCLLFSYANSVHEEIVKNKLKNKFISLSHEVSPEFREYERATATVINASIAPIMSQYLNEISDKAKPEKFGVMMSSGGLNEVKNAIDKPIETITSGPSAGVMASQWLGKILGINNLITFDMGGTSTDVSLISETISFTDISEIKGLPARVHRVDVHTIGCGGGSIAWVDEAGALRVGPESAGAYPGPAFYGNAPLFTVSDANLILGLLPLEYYSLKIGAQHALQKAKLAALPLSEKFRVDEITLSERVREISESQMSSAIRKISSARGYDPADYSLVCYGGAGGLHACAIAEQLGIKQIIVPKFPGVFSAFGLLISPWIIEKSRTVLGKYSHENWNKVYESLLQSARSEAQSNYEGIILSAGMRYKGQSHEITVSARKENTIWDFEYVASEFEKLHKLYYGIAMKGREVEWVNARIRLEKYPQEIQFKLDVPSQTCTEKSTAIFQNSQMYTARIFNRHSLSNGVSITGPAIIAQSDATTYLPHGWVAQNDELAMIVNKK